MRQPNRQFIVGICAGLLALGLILAVALAPVGIIVPSAELFEGEIGGCGDFGIYRFNKWHTLAISVEVDERKLTKIQGRVEIDLAQSRGNCSVEIRQFRSSAPTYFCDDVGGDPHVIATWKAISGRIAFEDDAPPDPTSLPCQGPHSHSVSVDLAEVVVENTETKERVRIDRVRLGNVRVGGCAG